MKISWGCWGCGNVLNSLYVRNYDRGVCQAPRQLAPMYVIYRQLSATFHAAILFKVYLVVIKFREAGASVREDGCIARVSRDTAHV
jgi:hypothetical protein